MAKSALASSDVSLSSSAATTYYIALAISGVELQTSANEARAQITYRTAGTLSDIYAYVSNNSVDGDSTLRIRINAGNGTQSVSVPNSTTGHFYDATPSNTDSVVVGDEINYSWITGGSTGTANLRQAAANFTPPTGTFVQYAHVNQTAQTDATTNYWGLAGSAGNNNTTEARAQGELNSGNITFQNLFVYVSQNDVSSASTVDFRDDAASTSITVSITGSTTGIFEDTSHTATPATNSLVNFRSVVPSVSGTHTVTFEIISIGATSTDGTYLSPADNSNGTNTSTSLIQFSLSGRGGGITASEGVTQRELRLNANLSNIVVNVSANSANGTSTFMLRVDGADSACAASIGASATGFFEDTDSITVTESQLVNYQMTRGGTGTVTSRSMCCMISVPFAIITGTIVSTVDEADIVAGGKTLIITLTNDTWIAAGAGSFDLQRDEIIAGVDSAQSEATGWDLVPKLSQSLGGVVRTSDTVVTITWDAFVTYNITAQETITVTVPSTAIVGARTLVATPTFTIDTAGTVTVIRDVIGCGIIPFAR